MEPLPREYMLDDEWIALIKEAKDLGLSTEEVKRFLQLNQKDKNTV